MLKEDTNKLMKTLSTAYPDKYDRFTDKKKAETMSLYFKIFGSYPTEIVVLALSNYIKENQYPPTIAGLQEQIDLLLNTEDTDSELWNRVAKATANSLWNGQEEFNKLPPECQKWLGSPAQLKELGMIDSATLNTVVRGQFLKTIKDIKAREKAQQSLPQEVRQIIEANIYKELPFGEV